MSAGDRRYNPGVRGSRTTTHPGDIDRQDHDKRDPDDQNQQ
jgi:hypothetical protein